MIKNLLYSVYPRKDNYEWLMNVIELKKFYHVFNGARQIIIRVDETTVDLEPSFWKALFEDASIAVVQNDKSRGETLYFIEFLHELLSHGDFTFYAHTKGVSHNDEHKIKAIRAWRQTMYNDCLTFDFDSVLSKYACAGTLRLECNSPDFPQAKWCYVGNFWWVNNKKLLSKKLKIAHNRFGVEGFLGSLFDIKDSYCVGEDNCHRDMYTTPIKPEVIKKRWW